MITSTQMSISSAVTNQWPLHWLDAKGNGVEGIGALKSFLQAKFHTKDLGVLKYFLEIKVTMLLE